MKMKKIYLSVVFTIIAVTMQAQCTVTVTGQTNITCNGLCNGGATLTTVGTPTFTYLWSPGGQTVQNPTNLCAGVNTVTMTDASSCVATATVTITQPAVLAGTTTQVNISCNGVCDGSIDLSVTGGTSGYTYLWSPGGQTTQDLSALCAGTYDVTITDANSCTTTASVTITQPATLMVAATSMNGCGTACDKTGIATPTGGTAPYTYAWTPGAQTTQNAVGLCAGTFNVLVTDFNGCTANGVVSITNPPALTATSTCNPVNCFGGSTGSAFSIPSGGTPGYSYSWNTSPVQTTANATGLIAGAYTCTSTDANGCTTTTSCTITQPAAALSVTTSSTSAPCATCPTGSTAAMPAGGTSPYTYSWTPGGCSADTCTGLVPGTYTVTVLDTYGCSMTQTATVANTVGINESTSAGNVVVFPNPASEFITLKIESNSISRSEFYISNILGEKIYSENLDGSKNITMNINVSKYNSGIYFVSFKNENGISVMKFIKK